MEKSENSKADIYAEIEMLDNEWKNKLPNFMVNGTLPDTDGQLSIMMGVIVTVTSLILMIGALSSVGPIALVVFVFAGFAFWNTSNHSRRRKRFLEEKNNYELRRKELEMRLKEDVK